MVSYSVKDQAKAWAEALQTGTEPAILDLARIVFGLSSDLDRLEKLGIGHDSKGKSLGEKKDACIFLLASSLVADGLASLSDLEANPLELVSGIHKVHFCCCYLPSSMVGVLTNVKKYPSLDRDYPGIIPVVDLKRVTLERYLSSWTSAKQRVSSLLRRGSHFMAILRAGLSSALK